ncbi:MAG: MerR family transcriptional regulator [Lacrimispora sphenoides]
MLTPAATDRFTNYRLYAAEQIPTLNKIIFLRDLGFNVSEIAIALNHWEDGFIAKLLEDKRLEIENVIKAEQEKLTKIELAKNDILREKMAINYNVSIKSIPSYQVFSLRRIVPDYYAEGQLWKEMSAFADKNNIPVSSDTFTIYHDMDYREKDVDMEICAPVARRGENTNGFVFRNTEPVPNMACTMVYGPFENIAGAFLAFASWLQEHNQYKMIGQSRQIVHRGPWNEECPGKYLTEIQIPLERI